MAFKKQSTRVYYLLRKHEEIQRLKMTVHGDINKSWIKEFYNLNKIRIDSINERMENLSKEFFETVKNADGFDVPIEIPNPDPTSKKKMYKFNEGYTQEQFDKAISAIQNEETTIWI